LNKDQLKGSLKDAAGRAQRRVGQATGNRTQQVSGIAKQAEGKTQKAVGDVKETLKDQRRK